MYTKVFLLNLIKAWEVTSKKKKRWRNWRTQTKWIGSSDYEIWKVKLDKSKRSSNSPVQFSSVAQAYPTLCNPMDCNMPGLPVHHQLLEFTQTHVHWVSDAIQLSHPLSFPSWPTFNLSQDQGLFKWVSFCIRWPKDWSFK